MQIARRGTQRGQALLLITLSIPVIFGLLGLVVDLGWMYWRREACLTAAQAAAFASARAASISTSTYPSSGCNTTTTLWCSSTAVSCATSPTNPPVNNFQAACLYAKANGFSPGNARQKVVVSANNGSTSVVPGVSPSYYVTVTVTEQIPLTFLATLGGGYLGIASANSTAGVMATASGACLYVLDPAGNSLNASNNAQISQNCGVYVNSSSSSAITMTGSASITTTGTPQPPIQVTGGVNLNNNGSLHPSATTGAPVVTDPLSGLDIPWTNCTGTGCPTTRCQYTGCSGTPTHCDQTNYSLTSGTKHLSPGTYCGSASTPAISVSNGATAIFDAGMYVINGGGVNIQSGYPNTGSNVVFYLTGTNANFGGFNIANGASLTLSAPGTGDLADVLIYADRAITAPTGPNKLSWFQGGGNFNLSGIIYLPNSTVRFDNGTVTSGVFSMVVKDAIFAGGTYLLTKDPAGTLSGGSAKPYLIGSN